MVDFVKLKTVVCLPYPLDQILELVQGKTIEFLQVFISHVVLIGIEIANISQEKTAGVSYPSVGLTEALEDIW